MNPRLIGILLIAGALALGYYSADETPKPTPVAPPNPKPEPKPCPGPRPWGDLQCAPVGVPFAANVGGPVHADGTEIACHLPDALHQKNTGGSDGAGLCVYASARHSGRYQGDPLFEKIFDWMRKHPGGSYPSKFKRTLEQCARETGLPIPEYIQIENNDLEILKAACKAGLMPGVTYSFSPTGRYGGRRISHMVSLPHADDRHFVVLDNNYVHSYEWLTPQEFLRTYAGGGRGWAIILLTPPPPPPPRSAP